MSWSTPKMHPRGGRSLARCVGGFVLVCSLGLLTTGARADEPFRAVVRAFGSTDRDLLDRVRGQTNDLDLELTEVDGGTEEPKLAGQMAAADAVAARYHARAVVWFHPDEGDGLLVHVLIPDTGRLLVRRVKGSSSATPSELREGAALIVRSALRAVRSGASVGIARGEALLDAEPARPVGPPEPPAPPPLRPPAPAPWALVTFAGGEAAYTGVTARSALAFGFRAELRRFEAGASFRFGFATEHDDPFAVVRLVQHAGVLFAGFGFPLSPRLRLCACFEAGFAAVQRTTVAAAPGAVPAPSRWTLSPLFGPEVRATWRAQVGGGWTFGAGLAFGADVIPNAPVVGYGVGPDRAFVATRDPWNVQPRGQLTLELGAPGF